MTADLCRRMGVGPAVVPMTDDPVRTRLLTDLGWLDFQEYFVHRRCEPVVSQLQFQGAGAAKPHPGFIAALADPSLEAVVICPSNPFISVEPILAIPGVREALMACKAPIIAVSPIIAGRAVKGPTAKMMTELGLDPSAGTVAQRYADLLDGYVIDHADMSEVVSIDARVTLAQTLMTTIEDREALARIVLDAAAVLRRRGTARPAASAAIERMIDVWAAVPVKAFTGAKQRTASLLTPEQREVLAATMLEDVLSALAGATRLAGILVNTVDPVAASTGGTLWRARGHRGRARRPYRRGERHGSGPGGRREGRAADRAGRYPARDLGRDRRGGCRPACRRRRSPSCRRMTNWGRTRCCARRRSRCRCGLATTVTFRI